MKVGRAIKLEETRLTWRTVAVSVGDVAWLSHLGQQVRLTLLQHQHRRTVKGWFTLCADPGL